MQNKRSMLNDTSFEKKPRCSQLRRCAMLLAILTFFNIGATVHGDTIYGLKSRAVPVQFSGTPTHVFAFEEDGSSFTDFGVLTLGGVPIDADGLALSHNHGLVAFLIEPTGSTLVSIQPTGATASVVGSQLSGREIRGAVFDQFGTLWTIDAANNELLEIDPTTGQVVGSAVQLNPNVSGNRALFTSDIAVRQDGTIVLSVIDDPTSSTDFYELNTITGDLTILTANIPQTGATGIAFSVQNPHLLFGYDQQAGDDIVYFDTNAGFSRTNVFTNIINGFNSGGGDLANLTIAAVPEPSTIGLLGIVSIAILHYQRRRNGR